jgi:hypothetical protein
VRGIVLVSLCWFFVGTQRQLTFRAARRCSRSLSWPNPPQTAIPRGTFFFSQASAELEKGEERRSLLLALFLAPSTESMEKSLDSLQINSKLQKQYIE